MDAVPALREPDGVSTWTAADVRDDSRRRREISLEQCLGACELERALSTGEPVALEPSGVIRRDFIGVAA
jgi:hypothetical protein